MATIATAYVQIQPSMEGIGGTLSKTLPTAVAPAGAAAGKKLGTGIGSRLKASLGGYLKGIGGMILGAIAIKKIAQSFKEVETGANNVIKATGATGAQAKELVGVYKDVARNVVGDFGDIGDAVGELNTRFGLTGDKLQGASEATMKYAKVTGTDAKKAVQDVSRMMNNAGIDSSEYAATLDKLTVAAQQSGVDVSKLAQSVNQNAASFRQLGMSTDEGIAMLANFEKAGVESQQVLAGMKKGVAAWAKEGKSAKEGFADFISGVQDGSVTSADAIELFGARAGTAMYDAAEKGQLEFNDMYNAITKGSKGALDTVYKDTLTAGEKISLLGQNLKLGVFDILEPIVDAVSPHIDTIVSTVSSGIKWFTTNAVPVIKQAVAGVGQYVMPIVRQIIDAVKANMPTIVSIVKGAYGVIVAIAQALKTVWDALSPIIGALLKNVLAPLVQGVLKVLPPILRAVAKALVVIINILKGVFTRVFNAAKTVVEGFVSVVTSIINTVKTVGEGIKTFANGVKQRFTEIATKVGTAMTNVKNFITEKWNAAKTAASTAVENIRNAVATKFNAIKTKVSEVATNVKNAISDKFNAAKTAASTAFSNLKTSITTNLSNALTGVQTAATNILNALGFSGLAAKVKGVFNTVKAAITDPIGTARDTIKGIIDKIKGFFSFKVSLPKIKLPHFTVNPPGWKLGDLLKGKIPSLGISWYASGGIVDGPSLIGAGEAGPEAIVPLRGSAMRPWADSVAAAMGGGLGEVVTLLRAIYGKDSNIYLDGRELVNSTIGRTDAALGAQYALTARGLA